MPAATTRSPQPGDAVSVAANAGASSADSNTGYGGGLQQRSPALAPGYIALVVISVIVILAMVVAGYCCYTRRENDRSTAVVEAVERARAYSASPGGGVTYEAAIYSNPNYGPGDGMAIVRAASLSSGNRYSGNVGGGRGGAGGSGGNGGSGDSVLYAVPMESVKLDAAGYVYDFTLNAQQQQQQQQATYATPADHDDGSLRASTA